MPGMLLISPQAVMFEPTDCQSAPADDKTCTGTSAGDESAQPDCIIVPMDSISSIMISHHCDPMSSRSVTYLLTYCDSSCYYQSI